MTPYDAHLHVHPAPPAHGCVAAGDPAKLNEVAQFADQHGLHIALGLHPWWAGTTDVHELLAGLDPTSLDAVGEVGLDTLRGDQDAQPAVVRAQLAYARAHALPVVLHCVRAHEALLKLLKEQPVHGMIHAWTGSPELVDRFVAGGLYLSFGRALFRSSKIQRAALRVPADRLLVESDGEYPNTRVDDVVVELAALRGWSTADLVRKTNGNAARLFPRHLRTG